MVRLVDVVAVHLPDLPEGGKAEHALRQRVGRRAGAVKKSAAAGLLSRLRCAIFCRPAAQPTPREPLCPPVGSPQGPRGCSVFRTKGDYPVAAPQTRCKSGRGLNAGGQGRHPAARGVESAKIAVPARRIRSFPYPRKKFCAPESCPHFKTLRTAHAAPAASPGAASSRQFPRRHGRAGGKRGDERTCRSEEIPPARNRRPWLQARSTRSTRGQEAAGGSERRRPAPPAKATRVNNDAGFASFDGKVGTLAAETRAGATRRQAPSAASPWPRVRHLLPQSCRRSVRRRLLWSGSVPNRVHGPDISSVTDTDSASSLTAPAWRPTLFE